MRTMATLVAVMVVGTVATSDAQWSVVGSETGAYAKATEDRASTGMMVACNGGDPMVFVGHNALGGPTARCR